MFTFRHNACHRKAPASQEVDSWVLQKAFSLDCAHICIFLSWTRCQPVQSSAHRIALGICPCSGWRTGTQRTQTKPSVSTKHNPKSRSDPLPQGHPLPPSAPWCSESGASRSQTGMSAMKYSAILVKKRSELFITPAVSQLPSRSPHKQQQPSPRLKVG